MLEEFKNIKSSKDELRKFGLTIGIVLLLIALFIFTFKASLSIVLVAPGLLFIMFAFTAPIILLPFQKFWMALAIVLGWLSTRIILSIIFYLMLTPIRIIARIFGKEFLDLKIDRNAKSYWRYRSQKEFNPLDYEKQF
ncbi:MAG: hypothetical protein C4539_03215 [Ignavibacteriales bacterium]|nr:MAG: hypothetical protein C4539_03215 [Ignavibacteriales bacterium]